MVLSDSFVNALGVLFYILLCLRSNIILMIILLINESLNYEVIARF